VSYHVLFTGCYSYNLVVAIFFMQIQIFIIIQFLLMLGLDANINDKWMLNISLLYILVFMYFELLSARLIVIANDIYSFGMQVVDH